MEKILAGGDASVTGINASGQVCGTLNDVKEGALWSATGAATILKGPADAITVEANALSSKGDTVGFYEADVGGGDYEHAAYWSPTGKLTDLSTILGPPGENSQACSIDSTGDICGDSNGRAFLLIPTAASADTATPHFVESPIHHLLAASAVGA